MQKRNAINMLMMALIPVFALSLLITGGCGKKEEAKVATAAGEQAPAAQEVKAVAAKPITEYKTLYSFEEDLQGWEIPVWAKGKSDYVASDIIVSKDRGSQGASSLMIATIFPGDIWASGLVEIQQYLNLSPFRVLSCDVYIPADAPLGLKARLILTVGENWKFVEMNQSVQLMPGEWTTVTANIEPGSYDWKRVVADEAFAQDVRKIAVRVESNKQPKYTGPVYIDNIRVGR